MKELWTVQVAMPWQMGSEPAKDAERAEKRRVRIAPRMGKRCAESLALRFLAELGNDAKVRIINPKTGIFIAMIHDSSKPEGVEKYHGKDKRSA
jgi:hypothetical protein